MIRVIADDTNDQRMQAELPLGATRARWLTRAAAAQAVSGEGELHRPLPLPGPRQCPPAPQHRLWPGVPPPQRGCRTPFEECGIAVRRRWRIRLDLFRLDLISLIMRIPPLGSRGRTIPSRTWPRSTARCAGSRQTLRRPPRNSVRRAPHRVRASQAENSATFCTSNPKVARRGSLVLVLVPVSSSFPSSALVFPNRKRFAKRAAARLSPRGTGVCANRLFYFATPPLSY